MMLPISSTLLASAMLAMVQAQAVILSAKGNSGTSLGLQVDAKNQQDANFISQAEISANIVNECGRTLQGGNIDIGEQTELALTAGQVAKVKKGSTVDVTISQRSADGAGPFTCDMDLASNAAGITGQVPLKVTQGKAGSGTGDVTIKVAMPADMACIGASTGDICTVRCKNAANFGGCFAVQQTDTTPNANTPKNIVTAQTLDGVLKQVAQNQKDLVPAIGSIQSSSLEQQGVKVADALLVANPGLNSAAPSGTAAATSAAATATAAPAAGKKNSGNGSGNRAGNGNSRGNAGNGNGNGRATAGNGGNSANQGGRNRNNQRRSAGRRWAA